MMLVTKCLPRNYQFVFGCALQNVLQAMQVTE